MLRILLGVLILAPVAAWATLGESSSSFDRDRQALGGITAASVQAQSLPSGIRVYVMNENGVTIKEFADSSGTIFAIAWRGLTHPNLQVLLGQFHSEFRGAEKLTPLGRRFPKQPIVSPHLKVSRWGHMRSLQGLAILVDKLPDGVREADLQ